MGPLAERLKLSHTPKYDKMLESAPCWRLHQPNVLARVTNEASVRGVRMIKCASSQEMDGLMKCCPIAHDERVCGSYNNVIG